MYRLADLNIQLKSMYSYVHNQCEAYLFPSLPNLTVSIEQRDIDLERRKSAREDARMGRQDLTYPDLYLETLAVYRKIAEALPNFDGFVFHGSAMAVEKQGYIIAAPSGTGKSTHARLWRELLGRKVLMVNDDKPIIRFKGSQPFVYGSPWDGKEELSNNISVPLKAICFLERAQENHITEINDQEALPLLVRQTYRPSAVQALQKTLALLDKLNVKKYRLYCNMDKSAAELSHRIMKG